MNIYLLVGEVEGSRMPMYTKANNAAEAAKKFLSNDVKDNWILEQITLLKDITEIYEKDVEEFGSDLYSIRMDGGSQILFSVTSNEDMMRMLEKYPNTLDYSPYSQYSFIIK